MRAPAITHPSATTYLGDCLDVLAEMPADSVDAIVTDPPYGLGFMGKAWDDLPPGLDWAVECLRVLKPGGHLLAFGGTRTWHRLAVAVEDAGFEVRDSIAWLYGSGFPKSLDVSKAIDKRGGAVADFTEFRDACRAAMKEHSIKATQIAGALGNFMIGHYLAKNDGQTAVPTLRDYRIMRDLLKLGDRFDHLFAAEAEREIVGQSPHSADRSAAGWLGAMAKPEGERILTAPATPAAQQWAGWGTALKPAFEPIVVARKPLVGTVAANVLAHGTGALNIDGTRVQGEPVAAHRGTANPRTAMGDGWGEGYRQGDAATTPPNTAGRWPTNVVLDGDAAAELDEQSGILKTNPGTYRRDRTDEVRDRSSYDIGSDAGRVVSAGDSGGASRFFPTFRYQAKAPTRERPVVVAEDGTKTAHPTVKPLALMRWLVRLVTPPGGTVLDTFAGSGATIEAAALEGFHAIGIEREADYLPLIQVRLDRLPVAGEDPAA